MIVTVDTNILVRVLTDDDPRQGRRARAMLSEADAVAIAIPALCELVWVLSRGYRISAREISAALRKLIDSENVLVNRPAAEAGLALFDAGGDFADAAIAFEGDWLGGEMFVTFDRRAAKLMETVGTRTRVLS